MLGYPLPEWSGVAAGLAKQQAYEGGLPRAAEKRWHAIYIYLTVQQYGSKKVSKTTTRQETHTLLRKQSIRLAQHQVLDCTAAQQYGTLFSLRPLSMCKHTFNLSRLRTQTGRGVLGGCGHRLGVGCPLSKATTNPRTWVSSGGPEYTPCAHRSQSGRGRS